MAEMQTRNLTNYYYYLEQLNQDEDEWGNLIMINDSKTASSSILIFNDFFKFVFLKLKDKKNYTTASSLTLTQGYLFGVFLL